LADSQTSPGASKFKVSKVREIVMDSEIFTMIALAVLVAGGWLIDVLHQRGTSRFHRDMTDQLKKSADTIRGAPLP
jgi:hypothetical protein